MQKTKFYQEQLLVFLENVISLVEGHNYSLRHVDLCSKNIFLKNEIVVSYMNIIGDDNYWKSIDQDFSKQRNYTDIEYLNKMESTKSALFLKHDYLFDKHLYKTTKNNKVVVQAASNIDDFPYLLETVLLLYKNACEKDDYSNKIIVETLEEIANNLETYRNKNEKTKRISKELIKKLNEPKHYKQLY